MVTVDEFVIPRTDRSKRLDVAATGPDRRRQGRFGSVDERTDGAATAR
jgi:hypothetical protein